MSDVFNKVVSLFSREGDGSDKEVLVKHLLKEISQNKYAKFFRVRQTEIDPAMGQYFFSVYKAIYPLQLFLRDPERDMKIRQITLEAFLDKQVMDVIKRLSPEVVAERKRTAGNDIVRQLEEDLSILAMGFDSPKISAADKCFSLIVSMKQFAFFNYIGLLRKFDPDIREGDFNTPPKFVPVAGELIMSELSSFVNILPPLDAAEDDWKTAFEILKYCKGGTDVIPPVLWTNLLASLGDLRQSKIIDLIGRVITGNPILDIQTRVVRENLSAQWLEEKTAEVREVINNIQGSQKQAQINTLEKAVFGAGGTTRLSSYTRERGKILDDKNLESFLYAPALNHLYAFIQDYISKEINELCDILLVRGRWTKNVASRAMSEAQHELLSIAPNITELDESMDDDGSNGSRLKAALLRVDRDKSQARYINSIVGSVNDEALNMINRAVPPLIVVGKHFKMLIDDYDKKPFEIIMNWKELSLFSNKVPLLQRMTDVYKKINYFVQLMIMEAKSLEEEDE